jgi:two-component system chemotaxis response regulator CheY
MGRAVGNGGSARSGAGAATRCLIVDDSRVIRAVARKILEARGYEVEEAEDGTDGLEACGSWRPDAVLLEWQLPDMTGIEFVQHLPRHSEGKVPKVIFCSGEGGYGSIEAAVQAGAAEYIMKPFDSDIFESKLNLAGLP